MKYRKKLAYGRHRVLVFSCKGAASVLNSNGPSRASDRLSHSTFRLRPLCARLRLTGVHARRSVGLVKCAKHSGCVENVLFSQCKIYCAAFILSEIIF